MAEDYTKTLNLPQTDFSMRANLPQREPQTLEKWASEDTYKALMEKNEGKPLFILHDGPPYANGDIHIGHALNKILKDFIVKYKNMSGLKSPYVLGWDCHGLPTESAIIKKTKLDRNKLSIPEFRNRCRDFCLGYIEKQKEGFKRLGVFGDFENPYLTLKPEFEAEQIKVFGEMAKKGYIYKGYKAVYWCPDDETALAEAEIEYSDDECESIYVKFKVTDDKGKLAGETDLANTYFVIWTTTTWTLPGNLAICLNADYDYVLMKLPCGDTYIVAKELCARFAETAKIESYEIIAEMKGSEFEFMTAKHPFLDRNSIVILGEHVTLETGTGCVHTAPGHGTEDFDICKKYDDEGRIKIGVVVPVDARGYMTKEAGKSCGLRYSAANAEIMQELRDAGALVASQKITHPYAHCWRCKNPIIYRATEQWFASVSAMMDDAVRACDDIEWVPKWGKDRMTAMIKERSDWCISRQRNWGVPLPIFYCAECGKTVITDETIKAVSELFRARGSNAWYEMEADEIVSAGTVCPACGHTHFTKEKDIMDVWFDSGSTHSSVLDLRPELRSPADIYLEGSDQYRGWFQSSMLTSIAAKGVAPYKCIITHGWTVDGEGKAMHKSAGNAVSPDDIVKTYGADILRLWVSSVDYTNDVKISTEILKQLSEIYRKIRNTARIIMANLGTPETDFDPDRDAVPFEELYDIDKWAVSRVNKLIRDVNEAYNGYEFHLIYHALNNFCTIEMSKLYIDITKDRTYVESKNSVARRSAQTAMYTILSALTRMLAPILTFTAEEIWQTMPHKGTDDRRSVILNPMPHFLPEHDFPEIEERWNRLFDLRDDVMKALELARAEKLIGKSLEAKVKIYTENEEIYKLFNDMKTELPAVFIVSGVELYRESATEGAFCETASGIGVSVLPADGKKCVRCWVHSTEGKETEGGYLCSRCLKTLGI